MVDAVGPDNGSGASVGRRRSPSLPVGRGSSPPRHRTLRGDQNVLRLLLHGQTLLRGGSPEHGSHEGLVLGHGVLQGKVVAATALRCHSTAAAAAARVFCLTAALNALVDAAAGAAAAATTLSRAAAAAVHVVVAIVVAVVLIDVGCVGDASLGPTDREVVAVPAHTGHLAGQGEIPIRTGEKNQEVNYLLILS